MSWSTLRALSVNRVIHSASAWALVVPVTAKLMEHVQDVVTVEVFGHKLPLHLSLPFSWKVLFIVALAFMLANVVVAVWCPKLLAQTGSYRDFNDQQRTAAELLQIFEAMPPSAKEEFDADKRSSNFLHNSTNRRLHRSYAEHELVRDDAGLPTLYDFARRYLDRAHPVAGWAATLLYAVGFVGFAVLLAQNVYFVAMHW